MNRLCHVPFFRPFSFLSAMVIPVPAGGRIAPLPPLLPFGKSGRLWLEPRKGQDVVW